MDTFTILSFRHTWRDYQQRILDSFDKMLADGRLHIVAPPGAGKTAIGIEAIRRLNQPAIIFCPTITIKNQWIERLQDSFLPEGLPLPDWVSGDIHNPALFTVSTYQALHSLFSGKEEDETDIDGEEENEEVRHAHHAKSNGSSISQEEFEKRVKELGISTIVADECHHLKNEWWKSLTHFTSLIENKKIIALTATPPYDVGISEWQRYNEFCGPVDLEISAPELVHKQNLCPHHDIVFLTLPLKAESSVLAQFAASVKIFYDEITQDTLFRDLLYNHRFISRYTDSIEEICENIPLFVSLLAYLDQAGFELDAKMFSLIDLSRKHLPKFTVEWLETLLNGILFDEKIEDQVSKETIEGVRKKLHGIGAIENKKVYLRTNPSMYKLLSQSPGKIDGIIEIARLEEKNLGENLRMVILTDYIRKEYLDHDAPIENVKIGALSIFRAFINANQPDLRPAVLTGSIILLPTFVINDFLEEAKRESISPAQIVQKPLNWAPEYTLISEGNSSNNLYVRIITKLFEEGKIRILIGTKSLLGEGWDSPSINSLVLASFVGSFVLSNQMRGRAIRWFQEHPDKTANIWHLVCINPMAAEPNDDLQMMRRRFTSFIGISNLAHTIEGGIERLGIPSPPFNREAFDDYQKHVASDYSDRERTSEKWKISLDKGLHIVELLKVPRKHSAKKILTYRALRALFYQGITIALYVFSALIRNNRALAYADNDQAFHFIIIAAAIAVIAALPNLAKSLYLYLRNGPLEGYIRSIATITLQMLTEAKWIDPGNTNVEIAFDEQADGWIRCYLKNAGFSEATMFRNCMSEILSPIENPRYLIIRKSYLSFLLRKDYHSVPSVFSQNKDTAVKFFEKWKKYVCSGDLVFTRTETGRRILMKARGRSLSAAFSDKPKTESRWI